MLVASRFLAKNTILSPADLQAERRELSTLTEYATTSENLLGKQLRRALPAGAVVVPQAVKGVPLIRHCLLYTSRCV